MDIYSKTPGTGVLFSYGLRVKKRGLFCLNAAKPVAPFAFLDITDGGEFV